ncbi:MAG: hypothetical protein IKG77_05855 [Prevotella sp.]|nr:hypothetical protein [Prevotella sp.]
MRHPPCRPCLSHTARLAEGERPPCASSAPTLPKASHLPQRCEFKTM